MGNKSSKGKKTKEKEVKPKKEKTPAKSEDKKEKTEDKKKAEKENLQTGGHADAFVEGKDGTLKKKKVNDGEFTFYTQTYANYPELHAFLPKYCGSDPKEKQIIMEDLTKKFKKPCIMDLKMGVSSVGEDASEEKKKSMQEKDNKTTSVSLGIRIVGMKVWNSKKGEYVSYDKDFGKKVTKEKMLDSLQLYFDNGDGVNYDIIPSFLDKLEEIFDWFRSQKQLRFYSSSLLFLYDAENKKADSPVDLRMIDMAHVHEIKDNGLDDGYLLGLDNLSKNLNLIYKKSLKPAEKTAEFTDEQVKKEWDIADSDKSGSLSFSEVEKLVFKMNIKIKEKELKKQFQFVDADKNGTLDFEEFRSFLELLHVRPEMEAILETVNNDGFLTPQQFSKFLKSEQHDEVDEKEAAEWIQKFEKKHKNGNPAERMVGTGFQAYLQSTNVNSIFDPKKQKFIKTCHNHLHIIGLQAATTPILWEIN